MAYYYVKNGGTAVGDAGRYATQQTGAFAALGATGYYNNINAALAATTPPVAGDFINPSDLHSFSVGGEIYTGVLDNPFFIVCVDDANIDQSRTTGNRGEELGNLGGGDDLTFSNQFISGMSFFANDNIIFVKSNIFQDCLLKVPSSGDSVIANADGDNLLFINGEIALDGTGSIFGVNGAGKIELVGGSITTLSAGITSLFSGGFINGGGVFIAKGVDIASVTGTIIANVGSDSTADDLIDVRLDLCKLASGVSFTNEAFKGKNQRLTATRCSDSSAAAEYQYHLHAFGGDVDDDSAIFRNEDEAFTESNQKISYKIVTNSDASLGSPLWLDFPVLRYSELSAGATDTLRFYLTSDTALTDKDIYIEVSYPDGTNKQTANFLSSAPVTVGGTLDLMATGTTLTTDSTSTWTGGLTNKYQIDLNTSVDVGADCLPIVKVYITKPSVTIQIASEFGLS